MTSDGRCTLEFRDAFGSLCSRLEITAERTGRGSGTNPLLQVEDAESRGETLWQLKEGEVYQYRLLDGPPSLRVRCRNAVRRVNLGPDERDAGRLETRNYCGTLSLEIVDASGGESPEELHLREPVASLGIDVRSVKIDYRSDYRAMMESLTERVVGLVLDAQSSAQARFISTFEPHGDAETIQLQLEILRDAMDGADLSQAFARILAMPHDRLADEPRVVRADRAKLRSGREATALIQGAPRILLPDTHPLYARYGLPSVAARISELQSRRSVDTPENRFVRYVLEDIRRFLQHSQDQLKIAGWLAPLGTAQRLASKVDDRLNHSLFREVGPMRIAPLGSPVLQRRSGYREVLRFWLRFRTSARLTWEGGSDVFRAGQRDVATLYEYWLFFVLLDWFCDRFNEGRKPALEDLLSGLSNGSLCLKLRRSVPLGPFVGISRADGRKLKASLDYNKPFVQSQVRSDPGSWTRRLYPDYTFAFWPAELERSVAEERELLVYVHFDAKYRVENVEALFGAEDPSSEDSVADLPEEVRDYKRIDLMKMHAYRDAIWGAPFS